MTIKITHEKISPEKAEEFLAKNYGGQRSLDGRAVRTYADNMAKGAWADTGDPIKIDANGVLIDGQHRLHAIVRAGVPVMLFVARGIPADAYPVLDQGKKRTLADLLQSRGEINCSALAAAIGGVANYASSRIIAFSGGSFEGGYLSVPHALATLEREPGIRHAVSLYVPLSKGIGFSARAFCTVFYAAEISGISPDPFVDQLVYGENLSKTAPAYLLREALTARLARTPDRRMSNSYYTALIVRAWNAYARGDELKVLKGRVGGKPPVIFDPDGLIDKRWPVAK